MVSTRKFSEFSSVDWEAGVQAVGLASGVNTRYLVNLQFSATGNTAERPTSPATPTIRYNTDSNDFEFWDGTEWKTISSVPSISTTDNAIARFDGVNGDLQNSGVLIDDLDQITGVNQINVDNLQLNGNTISSQDAGGDINITPDTTGDLVLDGVKWPQADGAANTVLTTDGAGQASWSTATFPINGGTLNHILRSDGSNWVESTNFTLDSSDNLSGIGGITIDEIAEPGAPAADKITLFLRDKRDISQLVYKDSTGALINIGQDVQFIAKNTTGVTINKGQIVYVSGATGSNVTVALARADASATMPALGAAFEDIPNNGFGRVSAQGIIEDQDTSAFTAGDEVFVSETTAGELTNVQPPHPNLQQSIGTILTSNVNAGELELNVKSLLGDEVGTIQNTYAIGDGLAGTKTLQFKNANVLSVEATPTAARTITLPDATTTLVGTDTTDTLTNKTMGDELDAGSNKIINVLDPTLAQDAATKNYVDAAVKDIHFINPVRVASTSNFASTYDNGASGVGATLTASSNGAASIDGVSLSLNDRVLFKDQTSTLENGVYFVSQVGDASNPAIYTRATDFDEPDEIVAGDLVPVLEGTVNEHTMWLQTADVNTIGTDPIVFVQYAADFSNVVTIDGTQTVTGSKTLNAFSGTMDGNVTGGGFNITNLGQLTVDNIDINGNIISTTSGRLDLRESGSSGGIDIGKNAASTFGVELGNPNTSGLRYIDFHSSGAGSDFDVRFRSTEGGATAGSGVARVEGSAFIFWDPVALAERSKISNAGLQLGGANASVTTILDEDTMASDSATALATQQSIKAYVDGSIGDSGGLQSVQTFTSSGTWNRPSGISLVRVIVVGGGGGSGGCGATGAGEQAESGGGGGGGAAFELIDVSATSSETVTVGSGGSAGSSGSNSGGSGGTSSFGSFCSASGGSGGSGGTGTSGSNRSTGGSGGSGFDGDYHLRGGYGGNGRVISGSRVSAHPGGSSYLAGQVTSSDVARAGLNFGGGAAGGGLGASSSAIAGAAGAGGIVVVFEYA